MSKQVLPDEDFVITDPEHQPGVVLHVEPGIRPVALLEGYLSDKYVRCSFCRQRQRHYKGIFALLPEGSKALCGHCCAVEFTDKTTVAKIERDLDRRVEKQKQRRMSASILDGAHELLEVIDRDFIQLEREVHQMLGEMVRIFPLRRSRTTASLGVARGGLATIIKMSEQKLDEKRIEEILKKRALINETVSNALKSLDTAIHDFKPDRVRSQIKHLAKAARYEEAEMVGRTIRVGKWETHLGEYSFWETIYELPVFSMPPTKEIIALIR